MYVIGSYLICLALVLLLATVLFAGAVMVMAIEEIARLVRETTRVAFAAWGRLAAQWVPKPRSGYWPHDRAQHSH